MRTQCCAPLTSQKCDHDVSCPFSRKIQNYGFAGSKLEFPVPERSSQKKMSLQF